MRKALRFLGWGLGLGVVLLAGLPAALLAPVDRAGYEGTAYARVALERLERLGEGSSVPRVAGPLRAGFGRASLTPNIRLGAGGSGDGVGVDDGFFPGLPLAGYGDRAGRPATGVLDPLWVKAVAWEAGGRTGVMASVDSLIVPREVALLVRERLARESGLSGDGIYLGATHTHGGPGGWGEGIVAEQFAGRFVPGVREWMAARVVTAVRAALEDLTPAAVGTGGFDAPELVRNRLVGEAGRVDPRFRLLVVRQEDGDRAVVGCYAAHATVVSGRVMEFHGDYPGAWQRGVEEVTGGMALFFAGAVGSHAPRAPEGGIEGARAMGARLAEATVREVAGVTLVSRVVWDMRSLEVDLPPLQCRVADGWRLRAWAARRLLPVPTTTRLQYLRLNEALWLATPCDFSGELGLEVEDGIRALGMSGAVTSFNGDYLGYVVPSRHYGMNTYETRVMSFFGPQLPDYFAALLRGLARVAAGVDADGLPAGGTQDAGGAGTARGGGALMNAVERR